MNDFDAFITFGVIINEFLGTISRTIVNKDNLKVVISLRQNRFNAIMEVFFSIVNWDYNSNERFFSCFTFHIANYSIWG